MEFSKIRYALMLSCCLLTVLAQAFPFDIKEIGQADGLSNNYIMGIAQDKKGFMWFSTESGLNRYDGYTFRSYKKGAAPNAISGNELNTIYADKFNDVIWIATQRDGLNVFDCTTETFTVYKHDDHDSTSLVTNDITDLINSGNGNLWIATYYGGLDYFDKQTGTFTHYNNRTTKGWPSNSIWSIAENAKGTLYIGHVNDGLTIFSPHSRQIKNFRHHPDHPRSLPGDCVRKVFIDRNENLWVGTDNGLALFNPTTEDFTVFRHDCAIHNSLISNRVLSIAQLEDGTLWVGTENGGISILDMQNSLFLAPADLQFLNIYPGDDGHSLSNKTVRSIIQDSFRNIWIGTYGDGVNFISNRQPFFSVWSKQDKNPQSSLSHKTALAVCPDAENRLWIGTDGGGVDVFDHSKKIRNYNSGNSLLHDDAILTIFKDSHQNLWFGSFLGGVSKFDYARQRMDSVFAHNANDVRCFAEDADSNVWIGSSRGIYVFDARKRTFTTLSKENAILRENLVRSILFDSVGHTWVGSFGDGLSVYDAQMKLLAYFNTNGRFPSNTVNHIIRDHRGDIWVATGDGLARFAEANTRDFTLYNGRQGLNDCHIRAIVEDEKGNIWMSTLSGISLLNVNGNKFYNYGHDDGVPLGGFMSGSVAKTDDGTLYFGSHNGVCHFNPERLPNHIDLPRVEITGFNIYNDIEFERGKLNLPILQEMELDYRHNSFRVSFNVLDCSLNQLVEYAYQLKGSDDRWYESNKENTITFRNLTPGQYTLYIKSRIRNQEWSPNVTSLHIYIKPPFWATWWAESVYALLAVALVLGVIRFYKRRLILENSLVLEKQNHKREQELNDERLRFFTNITHELRTPLTLILGPLEDLCDDKGLSEKQSNKISMIYKSATRLLNLINSILEFRKTETQNKKLAVKKDDMAILIREIGLKYKELNTNGKVAFNTIIEDGDYTLYFDSETVSTIVDNLLSNAGKYTETGSITLLLHHTTVGNVPFTEIAVSDTGMGIHAESIPRIFERYYQDGTNAHKLGTGIGLALVYNLVKLHEGEIFVESELDKGSTFRFRIRTGNVYSDAARCPENEPQGLPLNAMDSHAAEEPNNAKPMILIVEDNAEINQYIVDSLAENYTVYSALNGKIGLEKARTLIPDIIVSDIMMPELDGLDMMRQLKSDINTSHIPIILLTAKDSIEDRTEAYKIGAESYITKPFTARLLRSRINNLLEIRRKFSEQLQDSSDDTNKADILTRSLNEIDREFIEKVSDIIHENIESDSLDVNFIATRMNMSHSSLYRKLKALTDMSVNGFVRRIRARKAEKLLLTGRYTISEIAFMVGINSPANFRQCFKDEFGCSPSEYLQTIAKK